MAVPEAVAIATEVCALVGEPRLLVDLVFAADEVPGGNRYPIMSSPRPTSKR
jgi:hypothetical protein